MVLGKTFLHEPQLVVEGLQPGIVGQGDKTRIPLGHHQIHEGPDRIDAHPLVAEARGNGQRAQLHGAGVDDLLFHAAHEDAVDGRNEETLPIVLDIGLAARLEVAAPPIHGENPENDVHLIVGFQPVEGLLEVVGDQGARSLDGEKLMLDRILAGRQDVHSIAVAGLDFLADTGHRPLEVDIGDQVADIFQGLAHPSGGDGVDLVPLAVDKKTTFQKDHLVHGLLVAQHRIVEIDFRVDAHDDGFRQAAFQLPDQLLVGEAVGHVVQERGSGSITGEKLDIVDDFLKVVAQNTLPAGDEDLPAGKGMRIFLQVEFGHGRRWPPLGSGRCNTGSEAV
ncbi:hypothetical protein DESC_750012 [Desulfosarcina cetonica]|nr:hypothetical protein DESC_750012 [Desulfosarcina cetonica]